MKVRFLNWLVGSFAATLAVGADIPLAIPPLDKLEKITAKPIPFPSPEAAALCRAPTLPDSSPHHGKSLEVFVNPLDALAYLDPWGTFQPGAIVLKQKLGPAGQVELYTGMRKRAVGYFPAGGDWEYFTLDQQLKVLERGKLAQCASCHETHNEQDFLFRDPMLKAGATQLTSGRVVLHSCRATPHGEKLLYETPRHKNTLGYWANPLDWAEWTFTVTKPGEFTLRILQGCGAGSGGSKVDLLFHPLPAGPPQRVGFTVEDTGHFQNFKERTVGNVTLAAPGEYRLEIRAVAKPGVAVMDLRWLVLEPKSPSP